MAVATAGLVSNAHQLPSIFLSVSYFTKEWTSSQGRRTHRSFEVDLSRHVTFIASKEAEALETHCPGSISFIIICSSRLRAPFPQIPDKEWPESRGSDTTDMHSISTNIKEPALTSNVLQFVGPWGLHVLVISNPMKSSHWSPYNLSAKPTASHSDINRIQVIIVNMIVIKENYHVSSNLSTPHGHSTT